MKYYELNFGKNRKEIGTSPQSAECHMGDIQQPFMPWRGKIDFDFQLPEPILKKNAKQTSYINVVAIPSWFLVIEDEILGFLKKFKIGNHQEWKIKTWQNKVLIPKYNLFFVNETKEEKYIDFKNSEFLLGKIGDWDDLESRKPIAIENYDDYINLKKHLETAKDKQAIKCNKMVLNLSMIDDDLFRIMNVPIVGGYFVSEKLKNAILEMKFTGMEFIEMSEIRNLVVNY